MWQKNKRNFYSFYYFLHLLLRQKIIRQIQLTDSSEYQDDTEDGNFFFKSLLGRGVGDLQLRKIRIMRKCS